MPLTKGDSDGTRRPEGTDMNATPMPAAFAADTTPVHDALRLTEGGHLARIVLADQTYSLRITRAGKLILTK